MHWLKQVRKMIMPSRLRRQDVERRVAFHFGSDSDAFTCIMRACDDARDMHRGKKRKNGEPVIVHERAMLIIALDYCGERDENVLVAIMLHDLPEDYHDEWPLARIEREYGRVVRDLVGAVTKPKREDFASEDEYDRATFAKVDAGGERAWRIKFYDRLHNNLTPWGKKEKLVRKILQTIKFVLPEAARRNYLLFELMTTTLAQMSQLGLTHEVMQKN